MKTEIRKIKEGLFRTCYDMGRGETTVPFDTHAEAEAFERGLEHAEREAESIAWKEAWKRRYFISELREEAESAEATKDVCEMLRKAANLLSNTPTTKTATHK